MSIYIYGTTNHVRAETKGVHAENSENESFVEPASDSEQASGFWPAAHEVEALHGLATGTFD